MSAPDVLEALKSLSEAHGASAMAHAFASLQQASRAARRKARHEDGTLAATYREAIRFWDAQKADGVSIEARLEGLERTLREAWPRGREQPWVYLCEHCDDRGLHMRECAGTARGAICGRIALHEAHEFGTPCLCVKGARFKAPERSAEDFTAAGKVKRSGFSRAGR